jgi:hypothetical protein
MVALLDFIALPHFPYRALPSYRLRASLRWPALDRGCAVAVSLHGQGRML